MRSNSCSSADSGGSCGRPERQASRSSRSLIPSRKVLKFFTSKEPHQLTDAVPAEVRRAPVDFAGILLEYTSVEDLSSMLGMTREEIERVMGVSAAWPFPAHKDGGCLCAQLPHAAPLIGHWLTIPIRNKNARICCYDVRQVIRTCMGRNGAWVPSQSEAGEGAAKAVRPQTTKL